MLCDVLGHHLIPLGTGPLPVTILHKTKHTVDMGKDANLEGYYNSALPNLFLNLKIGGELSCYTLVIGAEAELYIDMNWKIDNTP